MNTEHDIFVSAHAYEDNTVRLAVECSCGAVLEDAGGYEPQIDLDQICELAWGHRDE